MSQFGQLQMLLTDRLGRTNLRHAPAIEHLLGATTSSRHRSGAG